MDKSIKAQWVAALRSGDYQQGKRRLRRNDNTYCCLGVLCDLAVKAGVIAEPELGADKDAYTYFDGDDQSRTVLIEAVRSWAALGYEIIIEELMDMNDSGEYTFSSIADVIEEQL